MNVTWYNYNIQLIREWEGPIHCCQCACPRVCARSLTSLIKTAALVLIERPVDFDLTKKSPWQTLVRFLWVLFPTRPWLWAYVSDLAESSFSKNPSKSVYSKLLLRISAKLCDHLISPTFQCSAHVLQHGCQMSKLGFEPKSVWHQWLHIAWECYIPSHIFFFFHSSICEFCIFP